MCSALVSNACEDSATYTSLAQPARSGKVAGRRRAISALTASGERCGARGACVAQADSKATASSVSRRGRDEITAFPEDRGAAAAVRQFTRPRRESFTPLARKAAMSWHTETTASGADGLGCCRGASGAWAKQSDQAVWLPSARRCDGLGSIVIRIQDWPAWADNERERLRLDRVGGRVRWSS
ncbi:hypothetical protein XAP6164_2100023 [Xanthomonas phaseoli pv. phaseoli]|nr:hypothetical protein XAP6164_2100023 [Xanthomonas phaseoli pv. phaseoli]